MQLHSLESLINLKFEVSQSLQDYDPDVLHVRHE